MKTIPLTQGRLALVDDEDFDELSKFRWSVCAGYACTHISRKIDRRDRNVYMHRVILGASYGDKCDHISGDKLDNRRCNLRLATQQQNVFNRGANRNNKSGLKGVSRCNPSGRWRAHITLNGKQIHLGVFDDKSEASKAYLNAAKKHHGEFLYAGYR